MWVPKEHQVKIAAEAYPILKEHGLVYLAMEERTGKTITAMCVIAMCANVERVLVVTTKKAIPGWQETLDKVAHEVSYFVTNYHNAKNIKGSFDLVILDEAHKYISGYPKRSMIWLALYRVTKNKPIIYLSATPYAQGPQLLFNQFALSTYSPWAQYKNFYDWFKRYAIRADDGELPTTKISATQTVIDYSKVNVEAVLAHVKHLFITYTREDLGFEHEPEDVLHFIKLSPRIKEIYNTLVDSKALSFTLAETGKDYNLICDTPSKLRWALHMLEGGTLKIDDEYINLGNNEKADYILATWGDTANLAIMYHFKADYLKLSKMFKKAGLFQASSYAEGVDLSHYKHLVIYSQNHSTAQHTQRRARQANINRSEEIKVHYILVKSAASHLCYKAVSKNKKNFVDTVFTKL